MVVPIKRLISFFVSVVLAVTLAACDFQFDLSFDIGDEEIPRQEEQVAPEEKEGGYEPSEKLEVHFIDVGQADSILVIEESKTMLIDAGNNGDTDMVVEYIKKCGITKIDYLVGTHPHEDHIGGLDGVIEAFDIGTIYMPKKSHTTKTFEDVLKAISKKGLKVTTPKPGDTFKLADADCTILAPNSSSYEELNDYSVVIKLVHGDVSFLFTGDAEKISEEEMLAKGFDLSSTVLKLGHHGSSSSTTDEFLKAVNPAYGVISAGKGNDYGHPHKETMKKLKDMGIEVYRTDQCGTIIATSNKTSVKWNKSPGNYKWGSSS